MNKLLEDIFYRLKRENEQLEEKMQRFEKEPMILIREIFTNNDDFYIYLIQRYGEENQLEIQLYWYQYLLPELKTYFGIQDIYFHYNNSIFPSPIDIYLGEEPIAFLDIYNHQFEKYEIPEIIELKNKLEEIQNDLITVQKNLEEKEPALANPFVLGGANPFKLLDITIRQKKYKSDIRDEVHELQEYFFELEQERIRIQSKIQQIKQLNVVRENIIYQIAQRLNTLPGYHINLIDDEEFVEMEMTKDEESLEINDIDDLKNLEGVERGFHL